VARLVFVALVAIAIAASGLLGYLIVEMFRGGENGAVIGQAQVGGPFELVDGEGRPVTDEDFRGDYMLVYFGFTYCPDVCPTELQNMSRALEVLGDEAEAVRPVFITVDPERDTPEVMESYVENFHPRMVGLTGSPEQIEKAAKAYRVYYKKAESESASEYLMDHTSIVYLMGPEGEFLRHFSYGTSPEDMAQGIRSYL